MRTKRIFLTNCLRISKKDMLAAPVRERSDMPMVGIREVYREAQTMRPWDDVYEDLCKDLGSHYGLNDIREA